MGKTHFSGPIKAGTIQDTYGTTLGEDVANSGFVLMSQSGACNQATNVGSAGVYSTGIVIPAGSQIVSIQLYKKVAWDGVAATFNLGTSATATELGIAADNTGANVGIMSVIPGTDATRLGNWIDVGASDVRIFMKSTNTGAGEGVLTVNYVQARDLA
jgi:hypothetical protein